MTADKNGRWWVVGGTWVGHQASNIGNDQVGSFLPIFHA